MSTAPDPQTWVFPPLGAANVPSDASAAFGPISRGDKIQLEWAPASSTPTVAFICADNNSKTFLACNGNTSPCTYTFDQSIAGASSHVCWFFFPGTTLGNSLTFNYNNAAGSGTTWTQNSQIAQAFDGGSGGGGSGATTIISTVTTTATKTVHVDQGSGATVTAAATTVVETETITQSPHTLLTTIANPSTTFVSTSVELVSQNTATSSPSSADAATAQGVSSGSGISPGAAAGIAVGATVALALLILGIWALLRRRTKQGYTQGMGGVPETPGLMGAAPAGSPGSGPVQIPPMYKHIPPMEVQGKAMAQGYYAPVSGVAEVGSNQRPLPAAPARTIHEMAER